MYRDHYPHSFLVSRSKPCLTLFTPFSPIISSFNNNILLKKTAQNCDGQCIFDKTAYVQSQDFTRDLKFYTSSARNAHDMFHVCTDPALNTEPESQRSPVHTPFRIRWGVTVIVTKDEEKNEHTENLLYHIG